MATGGLLIAEDEEAFVVGHAVPALRLYQAGSLAKRAGGRGAVLWAGRVWVAKGRLGGSSGRVVPALTSGVLVVSRLEWSGLGGASGEVG